MLSCKDVMDSLADYLEDPVAVKLRGDLEAHLGECRTCQALFDSTRKTIRVVTESGSFEIPENLTERIVSKVMARIPRGFKRKPPHDA